MAKRRWRFTDERKKALAKAQKEHVRICRLGRAARDKK